jgi:hypothetical protein
MAFDLTDSESGERIPLVRRPVAMALVTVLLIGGFYVLREHWGHLLGLWPYLLLLACPLMHLMHGHGGHGHRGHGDHNSDTTHSK